MITAAAPRVWSTAFFTAVARYLVVGAVTGSLAGLALGLLLVLSGASSSGWADAVVTLSTLAGAALSLPVAVVGAATGLLVAVRWPRRRGLALAGLLWCPVLLVGALVLLWWSQDERGPLQQVVALLVVEAVVVASVTATRRWVTDPLIGGVSARR